MPPKGGVMDRVAALEAHTVQLGKYVKQQQSAMPAFAEALETLVREVAVLSASARQEPHDVAAKVDVAASGGSHNSHGLNQPKTSASKVTLQSECETVAKSLGGQVRAANEALLHLNAVMAKVGDYAKGLSDIQAASDYSLRSAYDCWGEINDKLLTKEREAIRHLNSTSARCMAELRASELFRQQEFESRLSAEAAAELERFCKQLKLHSEDNRRIVSSDIDQLREVVLDEVSEILTAKGPCSAGGDDDRVSRQLDLFSRMIRTADGRLRQMQSELRKVQYEQLLGRVNGAGLFFQLEGEHDLSESPDLSSAGVHDDEQRGDDESWEAFARRVQSDEDRNPAGWWNYPPTSCLPSESRTIAAVGQPRGAPRGSGKFEHFGQTLLANIAGATAVSAVTRAAITAEEIRCLLAAPVQTRMRRYQFSRDCVACVEARWAGTTSRPC